MVHDAEIAATLMNRWGTAGNTRGKALELLKEGRLHFSVERGFLTDSAAHLGRRVEFECLLFEDGSRVLRLVDAGSARGLTSWSSVGPATDALNSINAAGTRTNYDRPHTDGPHLLCD